MKLEVFPAFYFKVIASFLFQTIESITRAEKKENTLFFDNILQLC